MRALIIAVCLGAGGLLGAASPQANGGRADPPRAAECRKDADCVLVPDGCCGCSEGGKQRAIAARDRAAAESRRKKECEGTMCAAVMSQDPSCSAAAVCRAGKCALGR